MPKQALALNSAYFLPGGDCLLYGDYALPEGRQGLLFRLTAGAEEELSADSVQQLCIWPEREFFAYTDYLQAYFLARPGVCVLSNQTQHRFLLYDAASGGTQEAALPAQLNLTPDDQAFWLAEGQYLLLRLQVDPKEPQRVATQVSLYAAAELPGAVACTAAVALLQRYAVGAPGGRGLSGFAGVL